MIIAKFLRGKLFISAAPSDVLKSSNGKKLTRKYISAGDGESCYSFSLGIDGLLWLSDF